MNFMIYFWAFFMYGMTFGLPLIIHYASGMWKDFTPSQTPGMAFFLLGLGCLLWGVLFFTFAKKFLLGQFKKKARGERLFREGRSVQGTILTRQLVQARNNADLLLLTVSFKNLAGAEVTTQLDVLDTEPEQNRFEKGRSVPLVIDPALGDPAIMVMGRGFKWNKPVMIVVITGLLLIVSTMLFLLVFGYRYESRGHGWRYLTFWHPFILTPLLGCVYLGVFMLIFGRFMRRPNLGRLTVYGQAAEASIISAERSGVSINEQPQVRVMVEFKDTGGRKHQSAFKKIVDLLDLNSVAIGNRIKIVYDANNPSVVEPIA
ncbi:MAG: hypothetical protein J7539_04940 [Niabella sp.]|nr:hypothetical protein [Niabella sp.]